MAKLIYFDNLIGTAGNISLALLHIKFIHNEKLHEIFIVKRMTYDAFCCVDFCKNWYNSYSDRSTLSEADTDKDVGNAPI